MNTEIHKERTFLQAIYKIKIFFLLYRFRNEMDQGLCKHIHVFECISYKRLILSLHIFPTFTM